MRNELHIWGNYRLITFNTRVAWWVAPYLKAVALIARATGVNPDIRKVTRRVMRGIRAETWEETKRRLRR
ncbi:MAG: hypothetical protein RXR52_33685 [Paraburkholderia sp.]|uniref:hypothetical protein n=1 Tax=Paraburkholderia sp. TaxID=1926495 RepID=UPI00397C9580